MFFHGIKWEYVREAYPLLSPRRSVSRKRGDQLADRLHLLQQFGLEPVHLLEAGPDYPPERCVRECLSFGDTVFAFERLEGPLWQLSRHEVGVEVLDVRACVRIYTERTDTAAEIRDLFPGVLVIRD
ncbi:MULTISPECIES: hypothetical protein [Brevibacillus]|jgi:hypothetical protein|uniref:Uncharacterized protein n=1 Tax=Brevibacillus thermoruber TaxID=33942 RepID=A0A9X3TTV6_9BACL|nr:MULTISPECIES: hypothetical protein [Brevibacillus]MDA5110308.1 hypothetical protein [Brevibacillus thermoruber]UYZ12522.1 hypothetical protein A6764_17135 [Brevibacillus sp. WF146]